MLPSMNVLTLLAPSRRWAHDIGLATIAGLVLGLAGPFGTYSFASIDTRLAYWVGLLWCSLFLYSPAERVATSLSARFGISPLAARACALLLATFPMSALSGFVAAQVWGPATGLTRVDWYLQVLLVAGPLAAVQQLFKRRAATAVPVPPIAGTAVKPRLFARSPKLDGQLHCLQMQDHYVRIYTSKGTDLILLRLSDAIEEATGVEGLQVHRSWWVARAAVVRVRREGQRLILRLENGIDVPVSRSAVARLRAAGWLPGTRHTAQ
jgi:LytTr DNA-binding domain